jgi:hypothetical protein
MCFEGRVFIVVEQQRGRAAVNLCAIRSRKLRFNTSTLLHNLHLVCGVEI